MQRDGGEIVYQKEKKVVSILAYYSKEPRFKPSCFQVYVEVLIFFTV
jgi:hypothetical protein